MAQISKMNATGRLFAKYSSHFGALSHRSDKSDSGRARQGGFSLIEMSVYLAVSGFLLSAVVPLSIEVIAKVKDLTNEYESATDRMRILNGKKPIRSDANPYVIKKLDYSAYLNSASVDASVKAVMDRAATNDAAQKMLGPGSKDGPAANPGR